MSGNPWYIRSNRNTWNVQNVKVKVQTLTFWDGVPTQRNSLILCKKKAIATRDITLKAVCFIQYLNKQFLPVIHYLFFSLMLNLRQKNVTGVFALTSVLRQSTCLSGKIHPTAAGAAARCRTWLQLSISMYYTAAAAVSKETRWSRDPMTA